MKLTQRARKFGELYDGNATKTAKAAGFKGSDNVLAQTGRRMLRNDQVLEIIKKREKKKTGPIIASREERQNFWTDVMKNNEEDMGSRLKASELLGRSQADFIDNHRIGDPLGRPLAPATITAMASLDEKTLLKLAKNGHGK